jgi:hypothetical protein
MTERSSKPKASRGSRAQQGISAGPAGLAKAGSVSSVPALDDVPATRGMLNATRIELLERIDGIESSLKADIARVIYLVEEQNSRNKVVLDGLASMFSRQEQGERRIDAVEETVRSLATTRPPSV